MGSRKYSKLRYTATIFMSYLVSLFLMLLITGIIILQTVFSPSYMTRRVDSSGFSKLVLPELQEIFISHGSASGISQDIMLSLVATSHIDNAIKSEIRAAYGIGSGYDFERYENEISTKLHNYAIERGYIEAGSETSSEPYETSSEPGEISEGLDDLAKLCVADFKAYLISPIISILGEFVVKFKHILTVAVLFAATITVLGTVLIYKLNRRITKWLSGYIYALGATGLFCALIPSAVFISGFTGRLNITPASYNKLISSWIEGIAQGYIVALIPVLMLLATLLIIWVMRLKKKRRHVYR